MIMFLEYAISDAVDKIIRNFPNGDCSASFKLHEMDSVGAMVLTDESGEYVLHLSVLRKGPQDACELRTCCPVRGNKKEIHRFLCSEKMKKQLTDKLIRLIND